MAVNTLIGYLLLGFSLACIHVVQGGWYKYQCPEGPDIRSPCADDCILNHGAKYGFCGKGNDYNCYCTHPLATRANGLQCWDPTNIKYKQMCKIDCNCNHGALDGICNYETHVCECVGQNPDPTNQDRCPYKSKLDMEWDVIKMKLPGFPKSPTAPLYPTHPYNLSDISTLYPLGFNPYNICAATTLAKITANLPLITLPDLSTFSNFSLG